MDNSTSNPFLTIIIPTYNSGNRLKKTLNSIIQQTFQNYEVLIIDGLSKDNTISIIKDYQRKFKQIKFWSEMDKGIYDAMNKGIGRAEGEWLYFLGSDDYFYSENILEEIFEKRNLKDYDVLYGNVYFKAIDRIYDGKFTNNKLVGNNICHQAIFFRKKVFKVIGNFNLKYRSLADWDHNIRWFFSSKIKKKFIDEVITFYGEGGFSSKFYDHSFYKDRSLKLLQKGFHRIGNKEILIICNTAIYYSRMDRSYFSFVFWKLMRKYYEVKIRFVRRNNKSSL